jgi:hypothetical protein
LALQLSRREHRSSDVLLIADGYVRGHLEVYLLRTILSTLLTILLVGGYLFVVGVLAQVVAQIVVLLGTRRQCWSRTNCHQRQAELVQHTLKKHLGKITPPAAELGHKPAN